MPAPTFPTFVPTAWAVRPSILGRGNLLVGPDPLAAGPGAMVIAPPDVLLRASEIDTAEPMTRSGWREARWGLDGHGHVLIDQARPLSTIEVDLRQVAEDVATWCPEHLTWIASLVERELRICIGRMRRDSRGLAHPAAEPATYRLFRLRKEADEAFAVAAAVCPERCAWYLRPRAFRDLVEAYIIVIRDDPAPVNRSRLPASGSPGRKPHIQKRRDEPGEEPGSSRRVG